jgi:hypothetical protein
VRKCGYCGSGRLKRVHRTFLERFSYLAIYECRECENEEFIPRRYTYHFGEQVRCPRCGTYRVTKLRAPDRVDRMVAGFWNALERVLGGNKLYHCCFCRVQFYDRRALAPRSTLQPAFSGVSTEPVEVETIPPEGATDQRRTANSDV